MNDVEWDEAALDELADIWVQVTPEVRDQIEAAVERLNRLLARDPHDQGESRAGPFRVAFADPIAVVFRIDPPVDQVTVVRVTLQRRRGTP